MEALSKRKKNPIKKEPPPKRIVPTDVYNPMDPPCYFNIDHLEGWKKGDPNSKTTELYDQVWYMWLLKEILSPYMTYSLACNIRTYFIRLTGFPVFITIKHDYSYFTYRAFKNIFMNEPWSGVVERFCQYYSYRKHKRTDNLSLYIEKDTDLAEFQLSLGQ